LLRQGAGPQGAPALNLPPVNVQQGARELVEEAIQPRNLCRMDPTYHGWF